MNVTWSKIARNTNSTHLYMSNPDINDLIFDGLTDGDGSGRCNGGGGIIDVIMVRCCIKKAKRRGCGHRVKR